MIWFQNTIPTQPPPALLHVPQLWPNLTLHLFTNWLCNFLPPFLPTSLSVYCLTAHIPSPLPVMFSIAVHKSFIHCSYITSQEVFLFSSDEGSIYSYHLFISLSLPLDCKLYKASVSFLLILTFLKGHRLFSHSTKFPQICLIIRITIKDADSWVQPGYCIRILRSSRKEFYQKESLEITNI